MSMNKKRAEQIASALRKAGGNRLLAAEALGVSDGQIYRLVRKVQADYPDIKIPEPARGGPKVSVQEDELKLIHETFNKYGQNAASSAEALGMSVSNFKYRLRAAQDRLSLGKEDIGKVHASEPKQLSLPKRGAVHRFILSTAQNNTGVYEEGWRSLMAIKSHFKIPDDHFKIATFTYMHSGAGSEGSAKRGTDKNISKKNIWYDARVEPFVADTFEELAPGLMWCGNKNILPTASRPLQGEDSYGGRRSCIIPHVKHEAKSVPSHKTEAVKWLFTTGSVTMRNYIQKRAGIRAEPLHCLGALMVEVDSEGSWWTYQLEADDKGRIHYLDIVANPDGTISEGEVEAIVWGDIHVATIDPEIKELAWGPGGMLDTLRPRYQLMHDMLDFRSRNVHNIKRNLCHDAFREYMRGIDVVEEEIEELCEFLDEAVRDETQTVIVNSNHDNFFMEWLRIGDYRRDPANACYFLRAQSFVYNTIANDPDSPVNILSWAVQEKRDFSEDQVRFLNEDEPFVVCRDKDDGIQLGMHGDQGANGKPGTPSGFAKMGRRVVHGHTHVAGIMDKVYTAGLCGKLDQGYNRGPSSWSHTHVVVYPNGKCTLVPCWKGKWRA